MQALDRPVNFRLPPELEAHQPPEERGLTRDAVRLLVSYRATDTIVHARFDDLSRFLDPGDLLVANDSGTVPAEITARRSDGTSFPLRLSTRLPADLWTVEPRDVRLGIGEVIELPAEGSATLVAPYGSSRRLWVAQLRLPDTVPSYLLRWGRPIRYAYVPDPWPLDMYQSVYRGEMGSAEMPSAGRPFTCKGIERLREKGIGFATLTLHTGVASLEGHEEPYAELYRVPPEVVDMVQATKQRGRRVIAVGTTVIRALESSVDETGRPRPIEGWTDLVITPQHRLRVVDGLLTGFHEPAASHLAMLEALAGRSHLVKAYRAAIAGRYLWHEFGDLHLIL